MNWKKLGRIFEPPGRYPWMASHAANPVAIHDEGDIFKIYFNSRDKDNRAYIVFSKIDLNFPEHIIEFSEKPVVSPGETGYFDDSGISMGNIVKDSEKLLLYYVGWNLGITVPWRNTIGLTISKDNGKTFEKYSRAPIMGRSEEDPLSLSYPFVMIDDGKYKMWYGSNVSWIQDGSTLLHVLKYADSLDGINWNNRREICLDIGDDTVLSKPCVIKKDGKYCMWFSHRRGKNYRIGYAESEDGIVWKRMDEKYGLLPGREGWDSDMACYPYVFEHNGKYFMIYCGNRYGKSGMGLAVLEK